jgi:hypothetical protein
LSWISHGHGLTKISNIRYPTEAFPAQLREEHPIGIPNVGKTDRFNYIHTTRPPLFRGHGGRCRSHPSRRPLVDHTPQTGYSVSTYLMRGMSTRYSMSNRRRFWKESEKRLHKWVEDHRPDLREEMPHFLPWRIIL